MTVNKDKRLSQIARELNVGLSHLADFLNKNGHDVTARPNAKISHDCYNLLLDKFSSDKFAKEESDELNRQKNALKQSMEASTNEEDVELTTEEISEDVLQEEKKEEIKEEFADHSEKEEEISENVEEISENEENISETEENISENENIETTDNSEKTEEIIEEQLPEEEDNTVTETDKNDDLIAETNETKLTDNDEIISDDKTETKIENISDTENKIKIIKKINLDSINQKTRPERKKTRVERRKERRDKEKASQSAVDKAKLSRQQEEESIKKRLEDERKKDEIEKAEQLEKENFIETKITKLSGPTVVGKIDLKEDKEKKKDKKNQKTEISSSKIRKRKRRKRIRKTVETDHKTQNTGTVSKKKITKKKKRTVEIDNEDVKKQVRETLAKLTDKKKKKGVKHRKKKREVTRQKIQKEHEQQEQKEKILSVTEFIPANEFATMMDVNINEVIKTCFTLGKMVTINTRLDADILSIVAEEFGFTIEFVSATENKEIDEYIDAEEDLLPRPPIVTVMGHVDHGKTSLLDFIRKTNVIAGEAGGITQHIGAYSVTLDDGQKITFLDTPGHEAFTAMRARGAKVTDLVIIIVAADDNIMPQTEEAISHAKAADVPIIFAINKIDKSGADPERIKKELAEKNLLIEEWGGNYQSKDISAKNGTNVYELLEEVTLAAEVLDLKANPNRPAKGTIIEATLDKGRGYIATILVQTGTLKIGDIVLAGANSGKVKAMYNERDQRIEEAGPSEPVLVLGLDGAPQAGDTFNVLASDKEARDLANKHKRLQREQSLRSRRHITLDEIGRRLKIGNFQELNVIIKGDVTGSIEAIADSFSKLSNEEIQIKVMHKAVGPISEADVMLATASDAVIIGFQVRPGLAAKKLADKEEIEIRLYSVIYDAINELKDAMEGMLSPEIREEITATVEIREVFKITKVGKVAGCFVLDGKINKDSKVRLIREGIVKYTGVLGSLKRYKDDVKEVHSGMECGLNIEKYDDVKVRDIIEAYKETEIARTL